MFQRFTLEQDLTSINQFMVFYCHACHIKLKRLQIFTVFCVSCYYEHIDTVMTTNVDHIKVVLVGRTTKLEGPWFSLY